VKYKLHNQEHQLSLIAFNVALGFKTEKSIQIEGYKIALYDYPEDFHDGVFWHQITSGHPYKLRIAKSTTILDPALRILHR